MDNVLVSSILTYCLIDISEKSYFKILCLATFFLFHHLTNLVFYNFYNHYISIIFIKHIIYNNILFQDYKYKIIVPCILLLFLSELNRIQFWKDYLNKLLFIETWIWIIIISTISIIVVKKKKIKLHNWNYNIILFITFCNYSYYCYGCYYSVLYYLGFIYCPLMIYRKADNNYLILKYYLLGSVIVYSIIQLNYIENKNMNKLLKSLLGCYFY